MSDSFTIIDNETVKTYVINLAQSNRLMFTIEENIPAQNYVLYIECDSIVRIRINVVHDLERRLLNIIKELEVKLQDTNKRVSNVSVSTYGNFIIAEITVSDIAG